MTSGDDLDMNSHRPGPDPALQMGRNVTGKWWSGAVLPNPQAWLQIQLKPPSPTPSPAPAPVPHPVPSPSPRPPADPSAAQIS
ncbi:unnamed protein product [Lota lota]